MNVAAQVKHEKTGKRKAREERSQATDIKVAVCCPSAIPQEAAWRKNGLCEEDFRDN